MVIPVWLAAIIVASGLTVAGFLARWDRSNIKESISRGFTDVVGRMEKIYDELRKEQVTQRQTLDHLSQEFYTLKGRYEATIEEDRRRRNPSFTGQ
jgi:hypothetical protein